MLASSIRVHFYSMDHSGRQLKFVQELERHKVSAMLVTHLPNIRYLCGFTGSAGVLTVLIGAGRKPTFAFFTDGRYSEQARSEVQGAKVVIAKGAALPSAVSWLAARQQRGMEVGFEAEHMSVASRSALTKVTGKLRLRELSQVVERLRTIKEPAEVDLIRAAVLLASSVFEVAKQEIKPGVTESSIAAQIEYMCRRMGAEGMSFDTLVAAGQRSALPHGVASQNLVPDAGFVILDFGVILAGYCSDMTRTVHVGRPDKRALEMYRAVLEAQLAGIDAVRPGVETQKVDYAARKVLAKAGLGRYFTHSTGHGVGIEIHEPPSLRKRGRIPQRTRTNRKANAAMTDRLEPGMVITIEPGVYLPGIGGVRIEDMVLVTGNGCEVLTPTRKDLIVL
jgi:Xaa-Pro aminopeptidase